VVFVDDWSKEGWFRLDDDDDDETATWLGVKNNGVFEKCCLREI
jgi:hypothetical protein